MRESPQHYKRGNQIYDEPQLRIISFFSRLAFLNPHMSPPTERVYRDVGLLVEKFPQVIAEIKDILGTIKILVKSNREFQPEQVKTFLTIGRCSTDFLV